MVNLFISETDNLNPNCFYQFRSFLIILPLISMNVTIQFDPQCSSMTVKIDDKTANYLLAAEMQAI